MNVSSIPQAAQDAAHDVAPWIERLARVGFVAKAILYMTVGGLAAGAALGFGGKQTDQRGAMVELIQSPLGRGIIALIAIGLAGYALWRIVEGVTDPEHRGHGAKGIAMRGKSLVTGIIHAGLAISAARLALGHGIGVSSERKAEYWTGRALSTGSGELVVGLVAAGFIGYGIYQLYKAVKSKLSKQLSLGRLSPKARKAVIAASRFGIASRGIVFGMIGVLFMRAAQHHNSQEAGSVKKSMGALLFQFGRWPYIAIMVGLIAYGVYQLINARYRRIDV